MGVINSTQSAAPMIDQYNTDHTVIHTVTLPFISIWKYYAVELFVSILHSFSFKWRKHYEKSDINLSQF